MDDIITPSADTPWLGMPTAWWRYSATGPCIQGLASKAHWLQRGHCSTPASEHQHPVFFSHAGAVLHTRCCTIASGLFVVQPSALGARGRMPHRHNCCPILYVAELAALFGEVLGLTSPSHTVAAAAVAWAQRGSCHRCAAMQHAAADIHHSNKKCIPGYPPPSFTTCIVMLLLLHLSSC